jgi:hypothetical protein
MAGRSLATGGSSLSTSFANTELTLPISANTLAISDASIAFWECLVMKSSTTRMAVPYLRGGILGSGTGMADG